MEALLVGLGVQQAKGQMVQNNSTPSRVRVP